jgi:hypothetical protein
VRHEHALAYRLLRGTPHQRRLAKATRRKEDDVLPVADVLEQLVELFLTVGEGLVEREVAEAERVDDAAGRVVPLCPSTLCHGA